VQCDILLEKLEYYGINGKAGDLIKSYLDDRYQKLTINNTYSKIVLTGTEFSGVYHKVQYSVHCFPCYTLTIYHIQGAAEKPDSFQHEITQ